MALEISALTKTYGSGVRALRGVTLHIERGVFGLLGANGAGKSTLMRILATLLEPDSGTVRLDGRDWLGEVAQARRALGYLPQEFGVFPRTSAEAMLDHIAALKGIGPRSARRAQVQELLEKVNLLDVRRRRMDGFSGGMKRRFGIAQALLGEPQLVIVDEPTAGLDPAERNRFYNLLSELGERAVVLLATHIVEDVRSLCSSLAIVGEGRVLASGAPELLIAGVAGKIWRIRVRAAQRAELEREQRVISEYHVRGETWLHVHSESAPGPGFEAVHATLEDAYFALLRGARDAGSGGARHEGAAA
jgi:ABC-2 type transport system ATP-binding protein